MTTAPRTYQQVVESNHLLPKVAERRLRALQDGPDKRAMIEAMALAYGLDPAKGVRTEACWSEALQTDGMVLCGTLAEET